MGKNLEWIISGTKRLGAATVSAYRNFKEPIDALAISTGAAATAVSATKAVTNTSFNEAAAMVTAGALVYGVDKLAGLGNKVAGHRGALATYVTGALATGAVVHAVSHPNKDMLTYQSFTETWQHAPMYAAVALGSLATYKAVNAFWRFTRQPKEADKTSRWRSTVRSVAALTLSIAGIVGMTYTQNGQPPQTVPNGITIGVKVDSYTTNNPMIDGDLANVDISIENANVANGTDLTLKYFMEPCVEKGILSRIFDSRISLGERADVKIRNKKGYVIGFFDYDASLEIPYEEGTAYINPIASGKGTCYKFQVQVWDGNKKLGEKFWGEGTNNPEKYRFNFIGLERKVEATELAEATEPIELVEATEPITRVEGPGQVFMYKQAVGSSRMDVETCAIADVVHPHLYDMKKRSDGTVTMRQRVGRKTKNNAKQQAKDCGYKIVPMVSAFKSGLILSMFENQDVATTIIANEIIEEKYDGVAIDLESIHLTSAHSNQLVEFMRMLRTKLPDKQIDIAVSPRFEGSDTHGYAHHGFYDFRDLSQHVDHIQVMAYDFHKGVGRAVPVMPADRLDDVVQYAQGHIPNDQIVVLLPLYGAVWTKGGYFIGPLSARNTGKYVAKATTSEYDNGELRIETSNRIAYAQDRQVFSDRFELLRALGISNAGGWRQTHGNSEIFTEFADFKAETP